MANDRRLRHYLAIRPQGELAECCSRWHRRRSLEHRHDIRQHIEARLKSALHHLGYDHHVAPHVMAYPSLGWRLVLDGEPDIEPPESEYVCSVEFDMDEPGDAALERLHGIRSGLSDNVPDADLDAAADLPIFVADYWNPAEAEAPLFGNRDGARRMLNLDALRSHPGTTGKGVNVVIIDQGIDKSLVVRLGGTFGGGWEYLHDPDEDAAVSPGETKGGHGAMMVRNLLDVAPEVTVFDCPMLPPRIGSIRQFLSHADAAYVRMLADIRYLRERDARWRGPWIFLNAWAIYDRASEYPAGDYTNNPRHRFNRLIEQAAEDDIDVIFCAGNCGQFCPAMRCGATDIGPGCSILGANSHPRVLTVGAVRVDGLWLGYSSQGPGQLELARDKPDLCAPSQFAETHDAYSENTGSSASSALAAGVVAALRSRWDAQTLSPDELRKVLVASARNAGDGWDSRLGHGILDAGAAFDEAARRARRRRRGR